MGVRVCNGCLSNRKLIRAVCVHKTAASPYEHAELSSYATVQHVGTKDIYIINMYISSEFGHVSNSSAGAVTAALLCSWCCTGRPFTRPKQGFRNSCLRCGIHTCILAAFCIVVWLSLQGVR